MVYRVISEHWIWNTTSERFKRWIDLLLIASWKERKVGFANEVVTLQRGQIVTSIRQLMKRWRTNNTTVKETLDAFVRNEMIKVNRSRNMTIITVVNYNKYQRQSLMEQLEFEDEPEIGKGRFQDNVFGPDFSENETDFDQNRVHFRVPIEEDNNKINNNNSMIDVDARAQKVLADFSSQLKIEQGCMSLRVSKKEYLELLNEVVSDWKFADETDWSARHLLNHLRRKVSERRVKPQENGSNSTGDKQNNQGGGGESPFERATTHDAAADS